MASGLWLSLQSKSRLELGIPLGVAVYQKHKANRISIKSIHARLATNNFLYKIGLKENDNCTFCQDAPETLRAIF